jgi:hypothetical protein
MEEIIVLSDDSIEAVHAAEYAYKLACTYNKNIVVANLKRTSSRFVAPAAIPHLHDEFYSIEHDDLTDHLLHLKPCPEFQPDIRPFDAAGLSEHDIAKFINGRRAWMVVHGLATNSRRPTSQINLQSVLNRVQCPFLMIPCDAVIRPPERIAYLADLRYAQIPVLNFLKRMNTSNENVILAHICAQGLPELDKRYAVDLFNAGVGRNVQNSRLFFSQLRVKDFAVCLDQVLNGMEADVLVCVNHHYHFQKLMAGNIGSSLPPEICIPVMVFPQ